VSERNAAIGETSGSPIALNGLAADTRTHRHLLKKDVRTHMFCRFCGSTLSDDSKFCNSCRKALTSAPPPCTTETAAVSVARVKPAPPKTKARAAVGSFIVGVLLIAGVLWWLMNKPDSDSGSSSPTALRQLVVQPRTEVLSNAEFALSVAQYRYIRFEVPQIASAVRVEDNARSSTAV
jgi:hypothetical protein